MSWTLFMDMHSGGGLKEENYALIYIEAPIDEACVIFYNRFGHNPYRVTCTYCGEDYSVDEHQTIEAATAYDRGCPWVEDERGWMFKDRPADYRDGFYLEPGQQVPAGMKLSSLSSIRGGEAVTVEEWRKSGKGNIDGGVLFIDAADIKPEERVGEVPEQGYVWRD